MQKNDGDPVHSHCAKGRREIVGLDSRKKETISQVCGLLLKQNPTVDSIPTICALKV